MRVAILIMLLVTSMVSADGSITAEDFAKIPQPAAADLAKLANPTQDQFARLAYQEQKTYLATNYRADFAEAFISNTNDFSDSSVQKISEKFFSELDSGKNVNNHRDKFEAYAKAQGIDVQLSGDVIAYWAGSIRTSRGNVDIEGLKDAYRFGIMRDGTITLVSKTDEHKGIHYLTGYVDKDAKGLLALQGTINGQSAIGENIELSSEYLRAGPETTPIVSGSFKEFGGLKFRGATRAHYAVPLGLIVGSSMMETILYDADHANIIVRATNVNIGRSDNPIRVSGELAVIEGRFHITDKAEINRLNIENKGALLEIGKSGKEDPDAKEPYITFAPGKFLLDTRPSASQETTVEFGMNSPYIQIGTTDKTTIGVSGPAVLVIEAKDIPEAILRSSEGSSLKLTNGRLQLETRGNELFSKTGEGEQTSVPMVLRIQDAQGNDVLGTVQEPHKAYFTKDAMHFIPAASEDFKASERFSVYEKGK